MRRVKKHKVKQEKPEASHSGRDKVERDLTYHIHDRVELMHQVFALLKPKELKAMAPHCVQYISLNDLQELCMEELLGISSKRLCAILDGADPPSDTESSNTSSSPEKMETISLDSISSDEEILSVGSEKKKKHKRRSKAKRHKRDSSSEKSSNEDRSKASRAGLTVLELLELQARARAIRAQLQQEQVVADATGQTSAQTEQVVSDDEVEIKEEPAEVVEISSEDEKPKVEELQKEMLRSTKNTSEPSNREAQAVTTKIKDLIITVPQAKSTRKIKLNRNKRPETVENVNKPSENTKTVLQANNNAPKDKDKDDTNNDSANKPANTTEVRQIPESSTEKKESSKERQKKKQKKKGKIKNVKEGSDHDEITLELSDTEKMDLLEDLDAQNLATIPSSGTEDSESSSDSDDDNKTINNKAGNKNDESVEEIVDETKTTKDSVALTDLGKENTARESVNDHHENKIHVNEDEVEKGVTNKENTDNSVIENQFMEVTTLEDVPLRDDQDKVQEMSENMENCTIAENRVGESAMDSVKENENGKDEATEMRAINRELSEGELSDRESSEVEASELKAEVVCISDDEEKYQKSHKKKKNKKKDKKSKKEKKSKKSEDFNKDTDQNFFTKTVVTVASEKTTSPAEATTEIASSNEDDVFEILELSSDSSSYEESVKVLSKEPTAEEIEALSAKIDEIEREEVVTEEQIREHDRLQAEKEGDIENISWKDRYLDSKKVKSVLTTSNIFNAMRKKNKELKRKLEQAKQETLIAQTPIQTEDVVTNLEEGSIEHYNTLEGSNKYVDPVKEDTEVDKEDGNTEGQVTKEMKKDAKQLLKMYKKLLKYNDMSRQSNPNKKKKKRQKKNKEDKKTETVTEVTAVSN